MRGIWSAAGVAIYVFLHAWSVELPWRLRTASYTRPHTILVSPMADRLGDLRGCKRQLDAELSSVRRDVKQARARAAATAREWNLAGRVRNVVLYLFTLSDTGTDPVLVYLEIIARQFHWPDRMGEEIQALVFDTFLAAGEQELLDLTDEAAPSDQGAFAIALDYVNLCAVATWTASQNEKGIAPSISAFLDQFEVCRLRLPSALHPKPSGTSASASARKRASNWRGRFKGRVGAIRVHEEVPADVTRGKAFVMRGRHATVHIQSPPSHLGCICLRT